MNIKETFLALTSKTYPYGYEKELVSFLPRGYQIDDDGNYFYKIGESRTIFASHLDTACKEQVEVVHKIDGDMIRTNGKSVLGADDKAGVTILLYLIEKKVPGLYYFFIGEEVGCIGSGLASKRTQIFRNYNRIISFDRRGTDSVITHQSSKRSCSDEFADALAKQLNKYGLNYKKDSTGIYTDSAEFVSVIPECTNISVGYYKEHTYQEYQDIDHLTKLCHAVAKINFELLPTKRDTSKIEWVESNYYGWGQHTKKSRKPRSKSYDYDRDYDHGSWYNGFDHHSSNRHLNKYRNEYYEGLDKPMTRKGRGFVTSDPTIDPDDYFEITQQQQSARSAYYENFKRIIFEDKLTRDEFITIQDQYLDMDNPDDRAFVNYLEQVL